MAGIDLKKDWWRVLVFLACIAGIVGVGLWAEKGAADETERIVYWTFIIFSVGIAELFLLFLCLCVFGQVDLMSAFHDKDDGAGDQGAVDPSKPPHPSISLSRLQAFLWTLIILVTYFHEAVTDDEPGLPSIPPELLLVMGISGTMYLASKQISANKAEAEAKQDA
jgi:hypothetical protein